MSVVVMRQGFDSRNQSQALRICVVLVVGGWDLNKRITHVSALWNLWQKGFKPQTIRENITKYLLNIVLKN